jgi:hypothetical protein
MTKPKVKPVDPCPTCGQVFNRPPGFYLDKNGPEVVMTGDDEVSSQAFLYPDVVRCGNCDSIVTIRPAGSISVRKPKPEEM